MAHIRRYMDMIHQEFIDLLREDSGEQTNYLRDNQSMLDKIHPGLHELPILRW